MFLSQSSIGLPNHCYRVINLPASSFTTLSRPLPSNPPVLCASQAPHIIDIENTNQVQSFPSMRNPIHTILSSSTESVAKGLFLASDSDRYINVFEPQSQRLVMNLVAENEVSSLSFYSGPQSKTEGHALLEKQALAVVTNDNSVEFFSRPFFQPDTQGSKTSLKAKSRQMIRRADATLKLTLSETSNTLVPVVKAEFQGPDLMVAWAEAGVIPVFERIKWLNEDTDELLFTGETKIAKTKSSSAINAVTTNGTKSATETQVDESKATLEQGNFAEDNDVEMEDTRPDDESDSAESDDDEQQPNKPTQKEPPKKDTTADGDVEMQNAAQADQPDVEEEETGGEPTFGDLLHANKTSEVDVEAELEDDNETRLLGHVVPGKAAAVQQIPPGVSLSTVLTQSLKTNDSGMLESCFHTNDLSIIRTTIQRLDSSLAATLLQRLAERLSSRPGRYGHLLVWVQWTCVAHGGALAGKPALLKKMDTLFKVMESRSSSLPSLLLLKGKLDLLDAQLALRHSLKSKPAGLDSEDEEENVIYVEGQDDSESDTSDAEPAPEPKQLETSTPRKSIRDQAFDEDETMLNGMQESENDEVDPSDDEEEDENENSNIFEVEAEESAGSSDAEESLEENEDEEDDESAGSMVDFIADSEEEDGKSDGEDVAKPPSKKVKSHAGGESGGGKGKGKNKSRR